MNAGARESKWLPTMAAMAAVAIVVVGILQFCRPQTPEGKANYFVGRVTDNSTAARIAGAKISLEEAQSVPPLLYTDSEGIFSFPLLSRNDRMRVQIDAEGYEHFDLRVNPMSLGEIQEFRLKKAQPQPSSDGSPKNSQSETNFAQAEKPNERKPSMEIPSSTHNAPKIREERDSQQRASQKPLGREEERLRPPDLVDGGEQAKQGQDFKFQLVGCSLSGSTVGCDFLVTNLLGDRELSFKKDATRIIADSGDEYLSTYFELGAKSGKYVVRGVLPGGVPIKARVEFGSVRLGTEILKSLMLGFYTWDSRGYRKEVGIRFGPSLKLGN